MNQSLQGIGQYVKAVGDAFSQTDEQLGSNLPERNRRCAPGAPEPREAPRPLARHHRPRATHNAAPHRPRWHHATRRRVTAPRHYRAIGANIADAQSKSGIKLGRIHQLKKVRLGSRPDTTASTAISSPSASTTPVAAPSLTRMWRTSAWCEFRRRPSWRIPQGVGKSAETAAKKSRSPRDWNRPRRATAIPRWNRRTTDPAQYRKFREPRSWHEAVRFQKTQRQNRRPPWGPSAADRKYHTFQGRERPGRSSANSRDLPEKACRWTAE